MSMITKSFLTPFLLFTLVLEGVQLTKELNYTFYTTVDGWLKIHNKPATWTNAEIQCETEGAVLASPLTIQLRDEIQQLVKRADRFISTILTGVHSELSNGGELYSVEGVHVSNLPVYLEQSEQIFDRPGTCIVWTIYNATLKKVKCEDEFSYVCYKKREGAAVVQPPVIHPQPGVQLSKELNYTFNTNADGWLKIHNKPTTWTNAEIQCEIEGAVLASPLTIQLRDEIQQLVTRADRFISTILTGVHSELSKGGELYSVEGVHVSNLPVNLEQSENVYDSSGTCVVWTIGNVKLRKVKCEDEFPYVCYRKLEGPATARPPVVHPQPGIKPNPPSTSKPITQRPQPTQTPSQNHTRQPVDSQQPYVKCAADGNYLIVINSKLDADVLKDIIRNQANTITVVYTQNVDIQLEGGQKWHGFQGGRGSTEVQPAINETAQQNCNAPRNESISRAPHRRPNTNYTYVEQANGWLKMHKPATWNYAKYRCYYEGATLASPLTVQLRDAIKQYVAQENRSVSTTFIGVYANFSLGDYYSLEGVSMSRMPVTLEQGKLITDSSDSCVVMSMDDTVKAVKCTDKFPFVCHKKKTVLIGCGTRDPEYVYDFRSGSCYKFHRQGGPWYNAYRTCKAEEAHLAVINSKRENKVLKDLFAKYPSSRIEKGTYPHNAYIGVRDWEDGKSWMTVEGKSLAETGFFGWASTEPNNAHGDEHCVSINRKGEWYDDPCTYTLPFICEKKPEILNRNSNNTG